MLTNRLPFVIAVKLAKSIQASMSATTTITETAVVEKVPVKAEPPKANKNQTAAQSRIRIPQFDDKYEQRQWQLGQMAGAFRIFAKLGFADGGSGHISLRGIAELKGKSIS